MKITFLGDIMAEPPVLKAAKRKDGYDFRGVFAYTETIQFPATGADGYRCTITFADGDTCQFDLFPSKTRVFYNNLNGKMLEETREFLEKEIANLSQV